MESSLLNVNIFWKVGWREEDWGNCRYISRQSQAFFSSKLENEGYHSNAFEKIVHTVEGTASGCLFSISAVLDGEGTYSFLDTEVSSTDYRNQKRWWIPEEHGPLNQLSRAHMAHKDKQQAQGLLSSAPDPLHICCFSLELLPLRICSPCRVQVLPLQPKFLTDLQYGLRAGASIAQW